jgi:hypothetical protein
MPRSAAQNREALSQISDAVGQGGLGNGGANPIAADTTTN